MIAGIIYIFAGSTPPEGFLLCDGSNVSRTTYSALYDAIGTTYGNGDGSTTFGLPDLSGKVALGVSSSHALASTGGEETHALTSSEIPSHVHNIPSHTHAHTLVFKTPSLAHSITQPSFNYNKPNGTVALGSSGTDNSYDGTTSTTATLSTKVGISDHAATACTMGGSITDCDAFNSGSKGSGTAHNNMQPYVTMNYIISTGE